MSTSPSIWVSNRSNGIERGLAGGLGAQLLSVLALVVLAILARADRLPPPGVVPVPLDGGRDAVAKSDLGLPAQLGRRLLGAQGVPPVVAEAVLDVLDQRLVAAGQLENPAHHVQVR